MVTMRDFNACGGVFCPKCQVETLRILNGYCPGCNRARENEIEDRKGRKALKRYFVRKFNRGEVTLAEMRAGRL